MQGSVLVIEDVKELADLVSLYLSKEGLEVSCVESAEDALARLEDREPDLILLDLNLPGMDGFEFLAVYRKRRSTPIMIVSARTADEDLISGLTSGADEFVTKPFSPRVLAARVRAILQRIKNSKETNHICAFGPFTIDYDGCVLKKNGRRIPLSAREYEVLAWFTEHPLVPASPEQIYNEVWKTRYGDLTTVAVYVQRLRKKIESDPAKPEFIETVHGMGYRFCMPENSAGLLEPSPFGNSADGKTP
ncbi:MAG: response regulator transcription factor [Treponema sp.]|jgi:two-component system response regulator RegX3|nr:response regulator transcription factor [Treponema sp.]